MNIKFLILSALILPLSSFGWGPIGHRAVGLIAEAKLTPQARAQIKRLLPQESLADASVWADELRSGQNYKQALRYHYESIPDRMTFLAYLKSEDGQQRKQGGTVTAILVAAEKLRSPTTPLQERIDSLKFLIHFVGDAHQPLHSGRPEDLGGNKIDVNWFGHPTNLHAIWDSGLIITGHPKIIDLSKSIEVQSMSYATYVVNTQGRQPVTLEFNPEQWINESLALRNAVYNPLYSRDQVRYQNSQVPVVDFRIYQAGLRLASVLNEIYTPLPAPSVERELWQKITAIVGDLFAIISFRP